MAGLVSGAMGMAGTLIASEGAKQKGRQVKDTKEFEAQQLDTAAGQAKAASHRVAAEDRRRIEQVESRALALAAMTGGAGDPGVVKMFAGLSGVKAYRSMVALYEGETKARDYRIGAATRRHEGEIAERTGIIESKAIMLKGTASMFDKYASAAAGGIGGGGGSNDFGFYSGGPTYSGEDW